MTPTPAHDAARLRPLERGDIHALALLVRSNRTFLAGSGPLRPDEYFTDLGQERAVLARLEAAEKTVRRTRW